MNATSNPEMTTDELRQEIASREAALEDQEKRRELVKRVVGFLFLGLGLLAVVVYALQRLG